MSTVKAICPCCAAELSFGMDEAEVVCGACKTKLITSALQASERDEHPSEKPEPEHEEHELTPEEREHQLKRKAVFKEELKAAVQRIDELHERRPVLEKQRRSMRGLTVAGVAAAVVAGLLLVTEKPQTEDVTFVFVLAVAILVVAVAMLVLSAIRRGEIIKQQDKLEAEMKEKKEKRDILIGRLNKIESRLHEHRH
jgi:hypothetical protein